MSRADMTVILQTDRGVARADYSGSSSPALSGLWTQPSSPGADGSGTAQFEALLNQEPRCARTVWLLSDEVWVNGQSMPAAATAGLNPEALAHALNFEAEPLSGISAVDAALGFANQGLEDGQQNFWVAQLRKESLDAYQRAAKSAGVRLAGILHPAGVPMPVTGVSPEIAWARLEVWPQVALARSGGPGMLPRTRLVNAAPGQTRAQVSLSQWLGTTRPAHWEWLGQGEPPALEGQNGSRWQRVTLDTDSGLRGWLGAWGTTLATGARELPVIRPVAPERPLRHFVLAGVVAEILVVLACYGYYTWAEKERTNLQDRLKAASEPTSKMAELEKALNKSKTELQKLQQANAAEMARQGALDLRSKVERRRFVDLLDKLIEARTENVVVRRIDTDDKGSIEVSGLTLELRALDDFASKLALKLGRGWRVHPPRSGLQEEETRVPVWEFSLSIGHAGLAKPETAARVAHPEHPHSSPIPAGQSKESAE